jgi:hypothetical protein
VSAIFSDSATLAPLSHTEGCPRIVYISGHGREVELMTQRGERRYCRLCFGKYQYAAGGRRGGGSCLFSGQGVACAGIRHLMYTCAC